MRCRFLIFVRIENSAASVKSNITDLEYNFAKLKSSKMKALCPGKKRDLRIKLDYVQIYEKKQKYA